MSNDKYNNNNIDKYAIIDDLVKASTPDHESADFTRPSDDAIYAYLSGEADPEQTKTVQKAISKSSDFRNEILSMAEDLEFLSGKKGAGAFDECEVEEYQAGSGRKTQRKESFLNDFIEKSRKLLSGRKMVLAGAVSAIAVIVVIYLFPYYILSSSPPALQIVKATRLEQIPVYQFKKQNLRSGSSREEDSSYQPGSGYEAAYIALLKTIEYKDGQYSFIKSPETSQETTSQDQENLLQIKNSSTGAKVDISGNLPASATDIEAWIIPLPSRQVLNVKMSSDSLAMLWDNSLGNTGCATFSYQLDGSFRTSPVQTFKFDKE